MDNPKLPKVPVEEVLRGIEVGPLPDSWTPLEAACMIKCLDEDGNPSWVLRRSDGIDDQELLGTHLLHFELLKSDLLEAWD